MSKSKFAQSLSWSLTTWKGNLVLGAFLAATFFGFSYATQSVRKNGAINNKAFTAMIINSFGFAEQWKLLTPKNFGISEWSVGQYAKYSIDDIRGMKRAPEFHVVGKLEQDHKVAEVNNLVASDYFWVKTRGFESFRNLPSSDYQLVRTTDMRLKEKNFSFEFLDGYIPLENSFLQNHPLADQAALRRIGRELVSTKAGEFSCDIWEADIDGVILKIWASPLVPPLGIVRMESEKERLELSSYGVEANDMKVPEMFQPVLDGHSTIAHGCESCHASDHDLHTPVYPPR